MKALVLENYNSAFKLISDAERSQPAKGQVLVHLLSILGWSTHNLAPLSFRGATYSGVFTLYPLLSGKGRIHHGDIMREATVLIESGKLTPLIDPKHYTMETVEEAYEAIENKTAKGKIVIDVA